MSRSPHGFSLPEMLVVLAIVSILSAVIILPRWDLMERRRDLAVDELGASIGDALQRGRAGEDWRLAWESGRLRIWRPSVAGAPVTMKEIALPEGLAISTLLVDGKTWPENQPLRLEGFATPPLRLEFEMREQTVVLRSLMTGRLERLPPVSKL